MPTSGSWTGEKMTKAWERYERGRSYNNRLTPNQYDLVNANIEFFAGNQWVNLAQTPAMRRLPKPTFNIIKRVASLFVASLTSSAATVTFDELSYYSGDDLSGENHRGSHRPGEANGADVATAEVQNLLEKFKMDYRIREALFDGAQTGDYCAHFYWDAQAVPYGGAFGPYRGEIKMELVDGINVMFGNPNTPDVEKQPYILIVGRDTVENLRREMEQHGGRKRADEEVAPDADYAFQAGVGGKTELEADAEDGKALYVYMYEKRVREEDDADPETGQPRTEPVLDGDGKPVQATGEDGRPLIDPDGQPVYKTRRARRQVTTVHVTKATRYCVIYEDVDTGLSRYPIAWGNWEKQKNQYHGRALVTGIIPNQIFINTMFAMVMRHLQLVGFPKTVYNADLIAQWSNEIGLAIGVRGMQPGQKIADVAYNLQPADMSNQIIQAIEMAITYTKDCLGATDAQLGNVKPDNTSALMVLQSNAEVPLENTRAGLYEWLEDVGGILLDMMGTYYGVRPLVMDREFQEPVLDQATGAPVLDPMTGTMLTNTVTRRVMTDYDFSKFKHLWYNVRVNAGATNYFSEIATVQTLDNLRRDGVLEIIDYLERIPDKLIPRKEELVESLKQRMAQMQAAPVAAGGSAVAMSGGANPSVGGPLSSDKALSQLPAGVQGRFSALPKQAQNALLKSRQ